MKLFVVTKNTGIASANSPIKIWHDKGKATDWVIEFIINFDDRYKDLRNADMLRLAESYIDEITTMDNVKECAINNVIPDELIIGGKYNWKHSPERLVYLGNNWSGNGYWHQFSKVESAEVVWCEVLDSDLYLLEETTMPNVEITGWLESCKKTRSYQGQSR